jgi:hypothetical protein
VQGPGFDVCKIGDWLCVIILSGDDASAACTDGESIRTDLP